MQAAHDLGNPHRQKRMARFQALIEPLTQSLEVVSILDIGGTVEYWKALPGLYDNPKIQITIVNLGSKEHREANLIVQHGDACDLPFADNSFDVIHSNSVIEHVGRWPEMSKMAAEVRRISETYFIQTPNVWFPIEAHFKLPFVHWIPEPARMHIYMATGKVPKDPRLATEIVQRTTLLSPVQMQCLFPDAQLWRERWMGLTKSIVAIKTSRNGLE